MESKKKEELLQHLVAINKLRKQIVIMRETNRQANDEFNKKIDEAMQAVDNHYNRITMELMKE